MTKLKFTDEALREMLKCAEESSELSCDVSIGNEGHYSVKPTGYVDLHSTTDARTWTTEWLKTIKKNPFIPTDEGCMIAWFSNAIMAGYDAGRNGKAS